MSVVFPMISSLLRFGVCAAVFAAAVSGAAEVPAKGPTKAPSLKVDPSPVMAGSPLGGPVSYADVL